MLKVIIKYFSESAYSTTMLRKERNIAGDDELSKRLAKHVLALTGQLPMLSIPVCPTSVIS
jgi:hypothetical protein